MSASGPSLSQAQSPLPAWRVALAMAALLPLSFNIGPWVHPKKNDVFLSPLDVCLAPLCLILLVDIFRGRLRDWAPPLPNLLLALVALLSLAWSDPRSLGEWGQSAVLRTTAYALIAVWVFRNFAPQPEILRKLALALGAAVGLCVLTALYQYMQPPGLPALDATSGRYFGGGVTDVRIGGWYEYRGIFAAQVVMWVPAAVALAIYEKDAAVRVAAVALAALALCVCMSGGGVLAAGAGVLAVTAVILTQGMFAPAVSGSTGGRAAIRLACVGLAVLVALVFLVLPRLPRQNDKVLSRTLTLFTPAEVERQGVKETVELPTARLRRYQAAINYLEQDRHWLLGAGAGKYQSTIGPYFDARAYPKPGADTDDEAAFDLHTHEKLSFGLVETMGVELGALGIAALAWVFFSWKAAALHAFFLAAPEDNLTRALALASFGAAVGAAVFSVFGSPLLRGCGGTFAFFAGMALALNARQIVSNGTSEKT